MISTEQLPDLRVVGTLGLPRDRYGVRTAMHEVHLRDGSLHRFHTVLDLGIPAKFLRALQLVDGRTYNVFDLRELSRALGVDLLTCADRDAPGIVTFTMRGLYATGQAMRFDIAGAAIASGLPVRSALAESETQ